AVAEDVGFNGEGPSLNGLCRKARGIDVWLDTLDGDAACSQNPQVRIAIRSHRVPLGRSMSPFKRLPRPTGSRTGSSPGAAGVAMRSLRGNLHGYCPAEPAVYQPGKLMQDELSNFAHTERDQIPLHGPEGFEGMRRAGR